MDLSFFSSDLGIAIAWICTLISFVYGFFQKNQSTKIKQQFESLKIENNKLAQKITEIEHTDIHDNYQRVTQNGEKNVNQGVVKGDVNIDIS